MILRTLLITGLSVAVQFSPLYAQVRGKGAAAQEGRTTVRSLINQYRFDEAVDRLQREIDAAHRRKEPTASLEAEMNQARIGANMLRGTEKVAFVDSMKVARKDFFKAFRLSDDCGTIAPPADISSLLRGTRTGASAFRNELGDRLYYSIPDSAGRLKLCISAESYSGSWGKPVKLDGVGAADEVQDYPFVMPDGVTLYYAAQGAESLGGYDIFVTRYNSETRSFVKPENIGMPFNSPANDYLYAVDETTGVGWFATDRGQDADSVCIYRFIPSETRDVYELTEANDAEVRAAARIVSLAQSKANPAKLAAAMKALSRIGNSAGARVRHAENFRFVVDDAHVYSSLTEFKNAEARNKAQQWIGKVNELDENADRLNQLRRSYGQNRSADLAAEIGKLEPIVDRMKVEVKTLEGEIRREEIGKQK